MYYLYAAKSPQEHFYAQIQIKQLENLSPWPLRRLKHCHESISRIMLSPYGEYGWMKSTSSAVWSLCLCVCVCMNADLLLITSHHTVANRAWEIQTRQAGIKRLMAEGSPARNEKDTPRDARQRETMDLWGRWEGPPKGDDPTLAIQVQVEIIDNLFNNT